MPLLLVTSPVPLDGKSIVVAGVAAILARRGPVRLVHAAAGHSAEMQAQTFALVPGVQSPGLPQSLDAISAPQGGWAVVEAPIEWAAAWRDRADATILVTRPGAADTYTLERAIADFRPVGLILNQAAPTTPREPLAGVPVMGLLPSDRLLAAPSISEMAAAVDGTLSGPEESYAESTEWLQIGPISAHSGIDHFRRFPDKTVVTRRDKIDVALAALDFDPACLILTGGEPLLPYIGQRAESEEFALITTMLTTPDAVARIGERYGQSTFRGRSKAQRAVDLVDAYVDLAALQRLQPV